VERASGLAQCRRPSGLPLCPPSSWKLGDTSQTRTFAPLRFAFSSVTSQNPSVATAGHKLIQLHNGAYAVYSSAFGEKMHPGPGPAAEAEALYIRQLKICERMENHSGEFVVWDVGLGAAANALTLLRLTRDLKCPLRLVSFDNTSEPLTFALEHADQLGYLRGYEATVKSLLDSGNVRFVDRAHEVNWHFHLADFPSLLTASEARGLPKPHSIFFDAFSPAKNPALWTLTLFTHLFHLLDPARPCNLTTYSRSTMLRVTLLLAGFFVGRGIPTGLKEETTIAANALGLIETPLDRKWLERAHRSRSAEPLHETVYSQRPLSVESLEMLQRHKQFHLPEDAARLP